MVMDAENRKVALARKLYSMHQFLAGQTGTENFGDIRWIRNDLQFGLGIGLRNGGMLRFFTQLLSHQDGEFRPLLEQFLGNDCAEFCSAISEGQTSFEQYLESQLVLKIDPGTARKVFVLPDVWQSRFAMIGAAPVSQNLQVDMVAGDRFKLARNHAVSTGIQSLRGFAMLFDLGSTASDQDLDGLASNRDESGKCLSLADHVLARMHGHLASHWQERLSSVFRGYGQVEKRIYDEKQFLGEVSGLEKWEEADLTEMIHPDSPVPMPGRSYLVLAGDRFGELVRQAYGSGADERFVLRQNPQILHPGQIYPGMRLFFPEKGSESHSVGWQDNIGMAADDSERQMASLDQEKDCISFGDRTIGPLDYLDEPQKQSFLDILVKIPSHLLGQTTSVELLNNVAIVCGHLTLCLISEEQVLCGHQVLSDWAKRIAAQVRGDILCDNGRFLPLASIPSQPHRREWMASSLRNLLNSGQTDHLRLLINPRYRYVDIMDDFDHLVLRLESEDFYQIRVQPHRRLSDYIAPPIVQMNELTQLWLFDLFGFEAEIAVPPISHANQYTIRDVEGETRIGVPMGTPVYPMMRGIVQSCGLSSDPVNAGNPGYFVSVLHLDGIESRYAGLSTICVQPGQRVEADQMIARSGFGGGDIEAGPELSLRLMRQKSQGVDSVLEVMNYFDMVCRLWTSHKTFEFSTGEHA